MSQDDTGSLYRAPLDTLDTEQLQQDETKVRIIFLRLMIRVLWDYRQHLILREDDAVIEVDRLVRRVCVQWTCAWA